MRDPACSRRPYRPWVGVSSDGPGPTPLGPVAGVLQEPGVSGGTVSGVCHGTLGELYQGPLRPGTEPEIAVVSFPVDRHSWVYFTPRTTACPPPHAPPLGEKSVQAAWLFLDRYGLALPPGD